MKIKVSEATPTQLDWLIAEELGITTYVGWNHTNTGPRLYSDGASGPEPWSPSTDWSKGGPIIEDEVITISDCECGWVAGYTGTLNSFGPTPLIAAMRCYASKLGSEVEVPESLIES